MRSPLGRTWLAGLVLGATVLAGCGTTTSTPAGVDDGATAVTPDAEGPAAEAAGSEAPQSAPEITEYAVGKADASAGVRSTEVPEVGDGRLTTVPGGAEAPEARTTYEVAVQVEGGLDADSAAFADFVMTTLNDPRGWSSAGYSFGRTDDTTAADVIVVLASPQTSANLCRPLVTGGRLSCREGRRAILTYYRWVNGQDDYGDDRTGYRQYVINHEVGHFLGRGHKSCPGIGKPAPLMMQQTKGLHGCVPNPWPSVAR